MIDVFFYDEKVTCSKPNSISDLLEEIKNLFLLSESDLNGLILQYKDDNGNLENLTYQNFDKFLKNKKPIVNLVCNESSTLFQEAIKNFEENEKQEKSKKEDIKELSQISVNNIQNNLESIKQCCEEEQKLEKEQENEPSIDGLITKKVRKCQEDLIKSIKEEILKNSEMVYYSNIQNSKVESTNKSNSNSSEHIGVSCNNCSVCPIKGFRYKCVICPSVDFCERCESLIGELHEHPLAVLKFPIV